MIEKMSTDKQLSQKLKVTFGDYQRRGFFSLTTNYNYNDGKCGYLPWYAVYKDNSIHTKVRIVFDASCSDKRLGISINNFLWKGPNLTNSLNGILLKFPLHLIVLTADVEKTFLQVKIKEEDRRYLRFYYLNSKDEDRGNGQLAVYHFKVNIFGSRAPSFIFAAVLQHHLKKYNLEQPALGIGRNILVDNLVTGTDTEGEAKTYFKWTREIFPEASMNIREWTSNHPNIMNHPEQQGIAGKRDTHVLGLQWTTKKDQLSLEPFKQHSEAVWTKGKIFSQFATLFDPFGWTAPATLKAKLFIRDLWKENWTWDEELHKQMKEEWNTIAAGLANATTFVRPGHIPIIRKVFVDSSLSAYAAAAYLNGELYMAKTRLASITKDLTRT